LGGESTRAILCRHCYRIHQRSRLSRLERRIESAAGLRDVPIGERGPPNAQLGPKLKVARKTSLH